MTPERGFQAVHPRYIAWLSCPAVSGTSGKRLPFSGGCQDSRRDRLFVGALLLLIVDTSLCLRFRAEAWWLNRHCRDMGRMKRGKVWKLHVLRPNCILQRSRHALKRQRSPSVPDGSRQEARAEERVSRQGSEAASSAGCGAASQCAESRDPGRAVCCATRCSRLPSTAK